MEQAIIALIGGDLSVISILLLFILGLLTKRFVPWWVYEQVLQDLKGYEDDAPKLVNTVEKLIEEIQAGGASRQYIEDARQQTRDIRTRANDGRRLRDRRKRGMTDE